MTLPANIRVNVLAAFPSQVNVSSFLTLSKANGVWSFGCSFLQFPTLPSSLLTSGAILPVQDPVSKAFYAVTVAALAAAVQSTARIVTQAGGIITALPSDGAILVNSPSNAIEVDLLDAKLATAPITVKDYGGNAAVNNITIKPIAGQTIDGIAGSIVISTDSGAFTLIPIPTSPSTGYFIR